MTALEKYNHLECEGLWRGPPEGGDADISAQRRAVVVSLGDTTLIISDKNNMALAHWSLSAIHRVNPKHSPAIYSPHDDSSETLELEEEIMIAAIEKITKAIERARPKPGRIRYLTLAGIALSIGALAVFWLPDAVLDQTLSVLPASKRLAIGSEVLQALGPPCHSRLGDQALSALSMRLSGKDKIKLFVMPDLPHDANHLPGNIILVSQKLIDKYDDPGVVSGYILAEQARAQDHDPMRVLLENAGMFATFKLLTTGVISSDRLKAYASDFVNTPVKSPDYLSLAAQFQELQIRAAPYAYAVDPSGKTTFELIQSDAPKGTALMPILTDGAWISLQGICEN